MSVLQALTTGVLIGMLQNQGTLLVDVEMVYDEDGNYEPWFYLTGRQSGERVRVVVEPAPKLGIGSVLAEKREAQR